MPNHIVFPQRKAANQGQALVETAIVLPLIIFFTAILIELCLIANAKTVLRYSAFCAARYVSVEPGAGPEEIKAAAVLPLLGVTGRSRPSDFPFVLLQRESRISDAVISSLAPNAGFAPLQPMTFNRDLDASLTATWSRTFVQPTPQGSNIQVEVTYFYQPVFPLARLAALIREPWEQDPSDRMRVQIQTQIGNAAGYEDWKKSDWLALTATAELPVEAQ